MEKVVFENVQRTPSLIGKAPLLRIPQVNTSRHRSMVRSEDNNKGHKIRWFYRFGGSIVQAELFYRAYIFIKLDS